MKVLKVQFFFAEYGAPEDAVQRQSSPGASPSAAASNDGAAAGPHPDRLRRLQEPLDPIAAENMPDMRTGIFRN